MVDSRIQKLEDKIRERIGRFVGCKSEGSLNRYAVLHKIGEIEPHAFLCGGAVRDILLSNNGNNIIPRDLDIVIGFADIRKVAEAFSGFLQRWNCYGGVSIQIKDLSIDLWSLNQTWAFEKKYVEGIWFRNFPKTTFLNIEAIAIELFSRKGGKRKIYSNGFFEAILDKTIEINLSENPNPISSIVRSLNVARRFNFAIGPKLAKYILHYSEQVGLQELHKAYQLRYRPTRLSIDELYYYIKAIDEHLRVSDNIPVKLPTSCKKNYLQRVLWDNLFQEPSKNLVSAK